MSNALVAFESQMKPLAPRFAEVLGKTMPVERLMRTIVLSVERLPQLLDCDRQSLFNSAMSAAVLGLEVDGVTGQAYLIPFKGRAQLVIGYKGYVTLAARSGITITGAVVREGDEFDYELGDKAFVRHKPKLGEPNRRIIAAWACASAKDRPSVVQVLGIDELMAVKAKSPGAKRGDSPWNDPSIGFPAMCEKTAKRRLARSMPLNIMQLAARLDEAVDEQGLPAQITPDHSVVIEGEFSPLPEREHSITPSFEDIVPNRASGGNPANAQIAGSTVPASPAPQPPGTEDVGTDQDWQDYCARWDVMLEAAESSGQIRTAWSNQKDERRTINPTKPQIDALLAKVTKRVHELEKVAP